MIAQRTAIAVEHTHATSAHDFAVIGARWRIEVATARPPLVQRTEATVALRRLEAGWKLTVLAPWGRAPIPQMAGEMHVSRLRRRRR